MEKFLHGASAANPLLLGATVAMLAAIAMLACVWPVRTPCVNPMEALCSE
jgi:hypothetical protein